MSLRNLSALLVFVLACAAGALPLQAVTPPAVPVEHWLVVSDIHLDPFDTSAEPVYYGKDSNMALFDSAIAAMRRAEPDPPVVVLAGDFLAHSFDGLSAENHENSGAAALATMQTIAQRFNHAFPHARFIVVLGNNDDPCGDYHVGYDSMYLHRLERIWAPLVNRNGVNPDFASAFGRGAYYTETYGKFRFVVLNSVYWSFVYKNTCSPRSADPGSAELVWLESQLTATPSGERNLIVMHIPPGVDAGSTSVVHGVAAVPFLSGAANAQLTQFLSDPADRIATVLAGHTHRTEFRTFGTVPMLIVPSISPIYGNSPTFFELAISPSSGRVQDFKAYMYGYGKGDRHQKTGSSGWKLVFDYDKTFGVTSADGAAFHAIQDHLTTSWRPNPAAEFASDRYTRCAEDELSTNYAACSGIRRHDWLLAAAAILVLVLAIAGYAIIRRK